MAVDSGRASAAIERRGPASSGCGRKLEVQRPTRSASGEDDEPRDHEFLQPAGAGSGLRPDPDFDREPGKDSVLVLRRDQKAGDHQLPHLQARARRPVLRAHLRADQGLRVLVRQVQAHEVQGHHLREVLGRSDAVARAARAHGPYRARGAGGAYLVLEVAAEPHRALARHDAQGPRAHSLFRILRRARAGPHPAQGPSAPVRRRIRQGAGRVRRRQLHRHDRRRSDPRDAQGARSGEDGGRPARQEIAEFDLRAQAEEARQAAQADRGVHPVQQQAGMDDPHARAGDPARSAAAGAARRRPLRHVRSQRPLSPRHQPQQPPEAADRAARSRHHHPQRKADAAGGGRRVVRQRPPRPRHHRRQQAAAEVARRHAQGQAGPVPAEPARQARRLFRPFGDRGRSRTEAASVRAAEEDGARTVQAVHLFAARRQGSVDHGEAGEEARREGEARGLGYPRRGHPRASGAAQPRADAASPRHPGVRAGADRRQGDPAASAGLRGVQRRLRRRPDGGARAAVARGAARSARPDDVDQQHPASRPTAQPIIVPSQDIVLGLYYLSMRFGHGTAVGRSEKTRKTRSAATAPRSSSPCTRRPSACTRKIKYRWEGVDEDGKPVTRWYETTPGRVILGSVLPKLAEDPVRPRQQAHDEARNLRDDRHGLSPLRSEGDGDLLRPRHGARLPSRVQGRHLVRQGRHGGAALQEDDRREDARPRQGVRAAIQRRPDHPGREVQQGRRRLVEVHRDHRRSDDEGNLDLASPRRRRAPKPRSTRST